MKKFKVTMLVPQERTIEAADIQEAHNQVSGMLKRGVVADNSPRPIMHSIVEIVDVPVINFGPSPAA